MIYLAGDIHGELEIYKLIEFFEQEASVKTLSEEDYVIILGDAGVCWDGGSRDLKVVQQLNELPVTVLWIDGNHENFDVIDSLPITDWHGGKVQFIGEKIIHLMRGYVYEISGKTFWAFGGGFSIDKMYRKEGVSWWPGEMPSKDEYERGKWNLLQRNNEVDYIITHTVPRNIACSLVKRILLGEEELQLYFLEIAGLASFKKWYFGHWHVDYRFGKYVGLYNKIVCLEEMEEENTYNE